MGTNAAALKPFRDLLSTNKAPVAGAPLALQPPEVPTGEHDDSYRDEGQLTPLSVNINLRPSLS
jgi:hypothetical protein